jgi:hypothetical protein
MRKILNIGGSGIKGGHILGASLGHIPLLTRGKESSAENGRIQT